jgi:hypothetical protein
MLATRKLAVMKACSKRLGLVLSAWAACAMIASGATEQWLQYQTSTEGRGYRGLKLTETAPKGITPPANLTGEIWYAQWTTPLDPKGRWMCFERTRKAGPHNRVFIDSNGNGRLDDERAIEAASVDRYSAHFEPARLVFQGEDGPITYHLLLRFMRYDDGDAQAMAQSGCTYSGRINVAGKKQLVTLVDANVNGTFNDRAPNPAECDAILIDGDKAGQRYLGKLLEIGGELFAIEVAQDGAFIKVAPAKAVALGRVRVPETISEFIAVGEPGHFIRQPTKGEFSLPAGQYRVHRWSIDRKDDKGAAWKLTGSGFSEFASFEVKADGTAAPDVGEPALAALTMTENKSGAAFSLRLKGRLGESIELLKGKERPPPPRLHLAGAGGTFRATNSFEYG